MTAMFILVAIALVTTSNALPRRAEDMVQRPQLPVLNLEDLIQPTAIKLNDADNLFPIKDPFTDHNDFKDEDIVQRPLGGMPPGFTWCPGGIKKLCLKSKLGTKDDKRLARRKTGNGRNRRSRANKKSRLEKKLERQSRSNRKIRANRKGKSKKRTGLGKKVRTKRRRKSINP